MDWDVFCATLGFTTEYVAPVSIRKSINLSCTVKVTQGSCREIAIGCLKSKGAPGPLRSSSEASLALPAEAPAFVLAVLSYSPASGALLPRPGWLPLLLGALASGKPVLLPEGSLVSHPLASAVGPCG